LVFESKQLNDNEKEFIIFSLKLPEVRTQLSEFLKAFSSPRSIRSEECHTTLGMVLMQMLDILQKEQDHASMRELHSIMHAS